MDDAWALPDIRPVKEFCGKIIQSKVYSKFQCSSSNCFASAILYMVCILYNPDFNIRIRKISHFEYVYESPSKKHSQASSQEFVLGSPVPLFWNGLGCRSIRHDPNGEANSAKSETYPYPPCFTTFV
jgi:hypothetical protein